MKTYNFKAIDAIPEDFVYSYAPFAPEHKKFSFKPFGTINYDTENFENFDYVSIISKKKYASGAKITAKCSFKKFGAPLIVLGNEFSPAEDGELVYGLHFEVVAWKGGCNVWHIIPFPENTERPVKVLKAGSASFEIKDDEEITLSVEVKGKYLHIDVNGNKFVCGDPCIPERFHLGYTACEGANELYSITIEE